MAEAYGREIVLFAVAGYAAFGAVVFVFADPVVGLFVNPRAPELPLAVDLVRGAAEAVVFHGVSGGAAGPLDAAGDARWPFVSQAVGIFGCAIPLAYLGATTPLGIYVLYSAFLAETLVPAALNYHRFRTGKWKRVGRAYRPEARAADD